ncbi:MAG: hypothetical protein HYS12_21110, partial [Planctomycetes bacterium]|nr:hypothetical protein [Planctomycetota bacterium]
ASTARAQAPKSRPAATGLTLSATILRGQRRVAMINGKFFAEGEPLKGVSAGPLTLARVFPDHVLLRQGEETLDLKFPEKSETRSPSPGAAKPAGPKRPAQTPPRTRTR